MTPDLCQKPVAIKFLLLVIITKFDKEIQINYAGQYAWSQFLKATLDSGERISFRFKLRFCGLSFFAKNVWNFVGNLQEIPTFNTGAIQSAHNEAYC